MRESAVEKNIRAFAEANGCIFLKLAAVAGSNGKPDRLVVAPEGKSMFLEIKKPGEDLEPLQKYWQKQLRALGHTSEWCDNSPKGIRLILELLAK